MSLMDFSWKLSGFISGHINFKCLNALELFLTQQGFIHGNTCKKERGEKEQRNQTSKERRIQTSAYSLAFDFYAVCMYSEHKGPAAYTNTVRETASPLLT